MRAVAAPISKHSRGAGAGGSASAPPPPPRPPAPPRRTTRPGAPPAVGPRAAGAGGGRRGRHARAAVAPLALHRRGPALRVGVLGGNPATRQVPPQQVGHVRVRIAEGGIVRHADAEDVAHAPLLALATRAESAA